MRTTRAFIAGLGTAGSLLAATACAFMLTSTLVAFNGWSAGGLADTIGSLFVDHAPVQVVSAGPAQAAFDSAPAAKAVVSKPTGPVTHLPAGVPAVTDGGSETAGGPEFVQVAPGGGGIAPEGGGGQDNGPVGGPPGSGAGTQPGVPQAPSDGTPRSPNGGTSVPETTEWVAVTVSGAANQLGDAVSGTTGGVGAAVGGPAGQVVTSTGQLVDHVITGVGQTVGGALRPK